MNQYFKIYKPFQVLSQFSKEENKPVLSDYFSLPKDIYPVGRLDFDSEGLLLLTNNKQLNHRLLNPQFQHKRCYWVQVDGAITTAAINEMKNGIDINIDGKIYRTKKMHAEIFAVEPIVPPRIPPIRFRKEIPAPWISLELTEGKNRQVRKMTAKIGFPTLRLIRYSMEKITIDGMLPGDIIELTEKEVFDALFQGDF
jgi:23S rRNA pseudouridine2457 synthase